MNITYKSFVNKCNNCILLPNCIGLFKTLVSYEDGTECNACYELDNKCIHFEDLKYNKSCEKMKKHIKNGIINNYGIPM